MGALRHARGLGAATPMAQRHRAHAPRRVRRRGRARAARRRAPHRHVARTVRAGEPRRRRSRSTRATRRRGADRRVPRARPGSRPSGQLYQLMLLGPERGIPGRSPVRSTTGSGRSSTGPRVIEGRLADQSKADELAIGEALADQLGRRGRRPPHSFAVVLARRHRRERARTTPSRRQPHGPDRVAAGRRHRPAAARPRRSRCGGRRGRPDASPFYERYRDQIGTFAGSLLRVRTEGGAADVAGCDAHRASRSSATDEVFSFADALGIEGRGRAGRDRRRDRRASTSPRRSPRSRRSRRPGDRAVARGRAGRRRPARRSVRSGMRPRARCSRPLRSALPVAVGGAAPGLRRRRARVVAVPDRGRRAGRTRSGATDRRARARGRRARRAGRGRRRSPCVAATADRRGSSRGPREPRAARSRGRAPRAGSSARRRPSRRGCTSRSTRAARGPRCRCALRSSARRSGSSSSSLCWSSPPASTISCRRRRAYGWTWDTTAGDLSVEAPRERLRADHDASQATQPVLAAVAVDLHQRGIEIAGRPIDGVGLPAACAGRSMPPIVDGRAPRAHDEVALGRRDARVAGAPGGR